jgi:hypothetical protein
MIRREQGQLETRSYRLVMITSETFELGRGLAKNLDHRG